MVNNTTNIGLLKPTEDELYSIDTSNTNMDIIDTNIKDLQDGQTASEILVKLKTVDSIGSGLDADLFNGQRLKDVGAMNNISGLGSTTDPNAPTAPYILTNHTNSPVPGNHFYIMTVGYGDIYAASSNLMQIAVPYNSTHTMYYRYRGATVWSAWLQLARTDSPVLIGTPTAPTAASTTDTTQIATTAFVRGQTLKGTGVTVTNDSWIASGNVEYPYSKNVPIAGVSSTYFPTLIAFTSGTIAIANAAGIGYAECYSGGVALLAKAIPTGSVTFDYVIDKP